MEQLDLGMPPATGASSARGRFPCPSCGEMLRNGAILCPYCDARFRKPAYDGAEVSAVSAAQPIERGASAASNSLHGQPASRSVFIATMALVAELVVFVTAGAGSGSSALPALPVLGAILLAAYAIHQARQAERRVDVTRDGRVLRTTRYGLILGMATIAFGASWFVTRSIDLVIRGI